MHVGRFLRVVVVAAFAGVVGEGQASAQLSGLTLTNNSSANEFSGSSANPSYERRSALAVQSSSATSFATRYSATVDADSALGGGNKTETLATDYTLAFDVTAPGAYTLTVVTSRSGDLNVGTDILSNSGTADTTAVTGTATGGTLAGGTLNLPDPGIASCGGPCTTSISQTASATITGTSNGVPVHHTLRFTFTSRATSTTGFLLGGQEAAVRLGIPTQDTSNGAGQYPGSPARTAASDGHFVTVTLSACGDGIVEPGEQCDLGTAQNGAPGSCCTSTCTLAPSGTVCRPAGSATRPKPVTARSPPARPTSSSAAPGARSSAGPRPAPATWRRSATAPGPTARLTSSRARSPSAGLQSAPATWRSSAPARAQAARPMRSHLRPRCAAPPPVRATSPRPAPAPAPPVPQTASSHPAPSAGLQPAPATWPRSATPPRPATASTTTVPPMPSFPREQCAAPPTACATYRRSATARARPAPQIPSRIPTGMASGTAATTVRRSPTPRRPTATGTASGMPAIPAATSCPCSRAGRS